MNRQKHWENVYQTKAHDEVSWFREHLDTSLRMIEKTGVGKDAAIIDVGGGNSTLVDDLFAPTDSPRLSSIRMATYHPSSAIS